MLLIAALAVGGVATVGGWLAARFRPSARARRRARKALRRVEREERSLGELSSSVEQGLERSAEKYAEHAREARLASIPVEDLKAFGADKVRWGVLRDAGVDNVAQVQNMSRGQLERLDGIGPVSVKRIVKARKQLLDASRDEPIHTPQVDDVARQTSDLRRGVHDVRIVREAFGSVPSRLHQHRTDLDERFRGVRRDTRLWRELLRGQRGRDERDAAVTEAGSICDDVERLGEQGGLLNEALHVRESARSKLRHNPTGDELQREHAAFFAEYTALIERALPGAQTRRNTNLGGLTDEIVDRVEAFDLKTGGLRLTLRGYQEFGAKFLLAQERTLLGDEMGLGKTIQALAVFCHLDQAREGERFLVVCPASVLHNWMREVAKWTSLQPRLLHGADRDASFRAWLDEGGVAVTSFRTLQALPLEPEQFADDVDVLVVDEAHFVKNPEAERTRTVETIARGARRVSFMSGTPLENRLIEFRQLVNHLQPAIAVELDGPISQTGDLVLGRAKFMETVAPVYLRRNQEDVLSELPGRIDNEEWVELFPEEQSAYREAVGARNIMAMRKNATVGAGPARSAKLDRLEELLDEYRENGRKVLVFTYFLDVLAALNERFGPHVVGTITGEVPPEERQQLADQLAAAEGHAILLGQITAAGVGMNLQSASAVILLEPQWKPSTEEQAIARAHRMGQTQTVNVHRFYATNSVDERMKEVLADKQELFDTFARDSAIKDASAKSTVSLTQQVIEAEVERLGVASESTSSN